MTTAFARRSAPVPAGRHLLDQGPSGTAFVSWGAVAARSQEIAAALGGEACAIRHLPQASSAWVPLRWALNTVGTLRYLRAHRPTAVIVTNPPVLAPLTVLAWARLAGAVVVVDSHPGGFGAQGDRVAARLQRAHAWLVPRARAVLVTCDEWGDVVRRWGGQAIVMHEAPPSWEIPAAPPLIGRPKVLYIGTFGGDEPIGDLVEAASLVPGADFVVTGDLAKAPPALAARAPGNVHLVGYLDQAHYRQALADADLVVSLTTEPTSVMRAACEAVWARRPLVVSDWPVLAEAFPAAVLAGPGPEGIASAIQRGIALNADLRAKADGARATQLQRWSTQLRVLERVLATPPPARRWRHPRPAPQSYTSRVKGDPR